MNNGPSPINAGVAGTPLSNQAVDVRKNANRSLIPKPNTHSIRDTLETSDREADGRLPQNQVQMEDGPESETTGLDLSG